MAAAAFSYRSQDKSSDSESEDSDVDNKDWKRATGRTKDENLEKIPIEPLPVILMTEQKDGPSKRKRNHIWSDVLEDQMMSETLNHCGIKNKPKDYGNRGEESYDYTLGYKHRKKDDSDKKISDDEMDDTSEVKSMTSSQFYKFFNSRFVKLDGAGMKAAKHIIHILGEKKHYLIFRVVHYLGIEKAMHLLKETEEIEEKGGMMIHNQQRRRTPGGVYFQLLKADKDIKKAAMDKIFEGEMNSYEIKQKAEQRKLRKLEAEKKKLLKCLELDSHFEKEFNAKPKVLEPAEDQSLEVMEEGEVEESSVKIIPGSSNAKGSDLEDGEIDD